MAISTCIKCGGHSFEVAIEEPAQSRHRLMFVRCATCGGVVGALDLENIGLMLHQQNAALIKIAEALKIKLD